METQKFYCDRCGYCCQNLQLSHFYDDLNDGTGTCIYFDRRTHLCTIYENRPDKCNVKKAYQFVRDILSWDEYMKLNYESCRKLKEMY